MLTDLIFHGALPIKFGWSSPSVTDKGRRRLIDTLVPASVDFSGLIHLSQGRS